MIILVMGVSGSGKTSIGKLLAESLNWEFHDADNFHTPANIEYPYQQENLLTKYLN
jgi:gluconokinase